MTDLPAAPGPTRLGLVIDLDTCVGCHACATSCKEWNTGGHWGPLTDINAYQAEQRGVWVNRVFAYEFGGCGADARTVHFPKNCLHCETPRCVTVCPPAPLTSAPSMGSCWSIWIAASVASCALGPARTAHEMFDEDEGVMKKCTLCIDRIYNDNLALAERVPVCVATCPTQARHFGDFNDPESEVSRLVRERDGYDLAPELGYRPTSKYLPPRPRRSAPQEASQPEATNPARDRAGGFCAGSTACFRADKGAVRCIPPIPSFSSPPPQGPAMASLLSSRPSRSAAACLRRPRSGSRRSDWRRR